MHRKPVTGMRAIFALILFSLSIQAAYAGQQTSSQGNTASAGASDPISIPAPAKPKDPNVKDSNVTVEERLQSLEHVIEQQQREIRALREMLNKQGAEKEGGLVPAPVQVAATPSATPATAQQNPASGKNEASERQKAADEAAKKFGTIKLSGDIRFRGEHFSNQGFDSLLEAPDRNRLRIRARLNVSGGLSEHFDWGLRLETGIFTDPISSNQTLTDFYERKPFALSRAFIRFDSMGIESKEKGVGVQLVAGKFEPTFRRTQMVWDDDVNVEGASEALYFRTGSSLRQVRLVAFQLPFSEQTAAKDGALYGGQAQTDWRFGSSVTADVNVAFYGWVRADLVARGLGAAATQVNGGIFNGAGVTGNQNGALGTTNRVVRDASGNVVGFLANFRLFDVLTNLTWRVQPRYPIRFTVDFVRNLSNRIDDEKNGVWAGVQFGRTKEGDDFMRNAGDWVLGYTFTRIEQDAVLVPFNFSDILASNSRTHMPTFGYQLQKNVTLQWTGLFSQRANQVVLISPFNRYVNRMQFDAIYKF